MKAFAALLPAALLCAAASCDGRRPAAGPQAEPDPATREVLRRINSVSAYETPALDLRADERYAHTAEHAHPFNHVQPFKQHFLTQMEYTGPGRAVPEPDHVPTVKIGFLGPIEPTVSVATGGRSHEEVLGTKMLQGAQLAIEEANARGGYLKRRIPFELVVSNDNGLWGSSGNEIIKLAYKGQVWAILGTIDGANSHIAIRVALKAEVVVMNSGDTDPTFIETNIPWVVRCIGDDRQQGYLLLDYLYGPLGLRRVGILRASNRYGRFGVREIRDGSRRRGRPIPLEMAYELGAQDFSLQLGRLREANVQAIVHWGDAADGARILNQMRAAGMAQPFFACDRCVADEFVRLAGANAEGVVCTYPWDPSRRDPKCLAFREAFRKRFGEEAETYAAHAYDGMSMLLWAIQAAGLNRAKIRDVLAHRTQPWPGVTGGIPLSACLDDAGEVFLARRENGSWRFLSRADLGLPRAPTASRLGSRASQAAHFVAREHPTQYAGPGRERAAPDGVSEVLIAWFGPSDPAAPDGDPWCAAQMAVEQANARGGCAGRPFRLVPVWSPNPWGNGAAELARVACAPAVWAILGGVDGASTHLAEQVAAKARLPLVSPVATDKTANLANVPWVFSLVPGDHLLAPVLAEAIAARLGHRALIVVSADDRDSRLFTLELRKALSCHHVAPQRQFECQSSAGDYRALAAEAARCNPGAVVVVASARDSARLVAALRAEGFAGTVFGSAAMGRGCFLAEAGQAAEGAIFPLLWQRGQAVEFDKAFHERFGRRPDWAAAHAYDAVCMLIGAIHRAGLNRARIGDALRALSPWRGVTGVVEWDPLGSNTRAVALGTIRGGVLVPLE